MKRTTISLTQETFEKLQKLAEKKNWSIAKTVEFILAKSIKNKVNAKENNS